MDNENEQNNMIGNADVMVIPLEQIITKRDTDLHWYNTNCKWTDQWINGHVE